MNLNWDDNGIRPWDNSGNPRPNGGENSWEFIQLSQSKPRQKMPGREATAESQSYQHVNSTSERGITITPPGLFGVLLAHIDKISTSVQEKGLQLDIITLNTLISSTLKAWLKALELLGSGVF